MTIFRKFLSHSQVVISVERECQKIGFSMDSQHFVTNLKKFIRNFFVYDMMKHKSWTEQDKSDDCSYQGIPVSLLSHCHDDFPMR